MRALVFGAGGLLGRALVAECCEKGDRVVGLTREECDVGDEGAVSKAVLAHEPAVVYNAAAMTDVDGAETRQDEARRANTLGPAALARVSARAGARLVHVSTDYVFDGEKGDAYDEADRPSPRGVYAQTKLEGERLVLEAQPWAIVARTAWLYGPGGKNFVSKIPELLAAKGALSAVADQASSPTRADELARLLRELARGAAGGLYHATPQDGGSYYEVALEAARVLGITADRITATSGAALQRAAPRPKRTVLTSRRLAAQGIEPLRGWRESFREYAARFRRGPAAR